jgi:hypothetical protein
MSQLLINPKSQFFDDNGDPLSGGKVYTYEAGTSTPLATYTDQSETVENSNPVVLDSRGEANIWLGSGNYKIVLKDADDVTVWSVDNVKYINDGAVTTEMLENGCVTSEKIADATIERSKFATGAFGFGDAITITEDTTITINEEVVLIKAWANNVTASLPPINSSLKKIITFKRLDEPDPVTDDFSDGDITLGTETINIASHPFINTQRVQLTTTGALPTGLSLATDYYIIYVDVNNIKLAASKADAEVGAAVDITAASGGGTHTITSQPNTVTIDGYLSETIDGSLIKLLPQKNAYLRVYADESGWVILNDSEFTNNTGFLFTGLIMPMHTYNGSISREQGWMKCDGRQINKTNYDNEHGEGSWDVYIGSSTIENKYLPDLTGDKYLTGVSSTTQDGSSAITEVGNDSNEVDLQHSHTVNSHNHKYFINQGGGRDGTFDSNGNAIDLNDSRNRSGDITIVTKATGTTIAVLANGADMYTDNQTPGTNNQLSTTQSIQPRSVEVVYYMRIV